MTDDKKSDDIMKLIILTLGLATAMYFAYLVLKERCIKSIYLLAVTGSPTYKIKLIW